MDQDCLVSCTVLAYNSASTILEALESIKAQTYQNIELIVSDDCSTDDTVELCRKWIAQNSDRFVRVELITVDHNTGVCANSNRVLRACKGLWRKGIAADDKLLPNCVSDFIAFVREYPEARWVSSNMRAYNGSFDETNYLPGVALANRSFFELDAEGQFQKMVTWNRIKAPSMFYEVALLREVGGYNEAFSFEDYPMFVSILEHGYRCFFMDKETVCYRIHSSSSHSNEQLFKSAFNKQSELFHREALFKYLTKKQIFGQTVIWKMRSWMEKHNLNKKTHFMYFLYKKTFSLVNKACDL